MDVQLRLVFNAVTAEQIKYLQPRDVLFDITDDMSEEQKIYLGELKAIYCVGLVKVYSIMYLQKLIKEEDFMSFSSVILRYNYNLQFGESQDIYEMEFKANQ